jgi:hypothetical protein
METFGDFLHELPFGLYGMGISLLKALVHPGKYIWLWPG